VASHRTSLRFPLGLILVASLAHGEPNDAELTSVEATPLVSLPPTVSVRVGGPSPRLSLSLPWSLQFGHAHRRNDDGVMRQWRAVLEPGMVARSDFSEQRFFLRLGLRRLLLTAGLFSFGVGAGGGLELGTPEGPALTASPEALLYVGQCCAAGYFVAAVRYEYSLTAPAELSANVGFSFW
jgi:hypothetical protein